MKKSFSDSQELEPFSQTSNFSDNSDVEVQRVVNELGNLRKVHRLDKLQKLCSEVGLIFPQSIDLPVRINV